MKRSLLSAVALIPLLSIGGSALAADILLNNGLAPPDPNNVIDHATFQDDDVYVRNVGCPTEPGDPAGPCASPGAPTSVAVTTGGVVGGLVVGDTSDITVSGGEVWQLVAIGSSSIAMSGGSVQVALEAYESSTITLSGGTVGSDIAAEDAAVIEIVGSGFRVDGVPVPFGDLAATTGTLTGWLASTQPIDNLFYRAGGDPMGTIRLVSAPPIPSLPGRRLVLLAGAVLAGMLRASRRAARQGERSR